MASTTTGAIHGGSCELFAPRPPRDKEEHGRKHIETFKAIGRLILYWLNLMIKILCFACLVFSFLFSSCFGICFCKSFQKFLSAEEQILEIKIKAWSLTSRGLRSSGLGYPGSGADVFPKKVAQPMGEHVLLPLPNQNCLRDILRTLLL